MRIYEIAKELGVSSKDIMSLLNSLGVACSSHMTVLSNDTLDDVRKRFSSTIEYQKKGTQSQHQTPKKELDKNRSKPNEKITDVEEIKLGTSIDKLKYTKEHGTVQKKATDLRLNQEKVDEGSCAAQVGEKIETKYFPKKSDYVAEPVVFEEEVGLSDELLNQGKLHRIIGKRDGDRSRPSFRSGRLGARRRKHRQIHASQESQDQKIVTEIKVGKEMPLFEVADMMGKTSGELVVVLFKKGMVCNKNNVLSLDNIRTLCEAFNITLVVDKNIVVVDDTLQKNKVVDQSKTSQPRWPIVVVMGHVDHGKTTLLDFVRKMNVAGFEKGGITQHLGAYEVESKHGKIVFIDTPGHEAFYHMRERGTKITDLAILVIAVDDGIKPQTVEAIKHAKAAGVPIVVAINKIDKMQSPAALETIKRQLVQHDLMPEEWGGNVIVIPISAKTGQGVDELLEMIVLQSQIMELKADPTHPAKCFILESKIEKGLGPVSTVICSEGTLHVGDFFTCGSSSGRVRLIINSFGKRLSQVGPSVPVQVVGFDVYAAAGAWLNVVSKQEYTKARQAGAEMMKKSGTFVQQAVGLQLGKNVEHSTLNLLIKADTRGSIDAVMGCIQKLSKLGKEVNCSISVVYSSVGDISESDIELAENTGALVLGFYVKPEKNAAAIAKEKNVEIRTFHVIYHLVEDLEKLLENKRKIELVLKQCGEATVKKIFDIKGVGIIAGCYVRDGVFARGNKVTCVRAGREVGSGRVSSLQRDKKTVKEVHAGFDCGFTCEGFNEWREGDTVLCYAEVKDSQAYK